MLINNPVYITAVLLLLVVLSKWLAKKKYFHQVGSALLVIISMAVVANISINTLWQNTSPVCDGIFTYNGPLAIFYLLLDVKLKDIKLARMPM